MRKLLQIAVIFSFFFAIILPALARTAKFGELLCSQSEKYECVEIQKKQSWNSLWPNEEERGKIQRLNRSNVSLYKGMQIAIPKNLKSSTLLDLSPLPHQINSIGKKQILVNLSQLAWGAYDEQGNLIKWGPASGGQKWCADIQLKCRTPSGEFSVQYKGGASCKSNTYPIPEGGAPMPYCMFFSSGFALHGSYEVPGYHASHGCVRLFPEDAKWLNANFVQRGTKVVIQPYSDQSLKTEETTGNVPTPEKRKSGRYRNEN